METPVRDPRSTLVLLWIACLALSAPAQEQAATRPLPDAEQLLERAEAEIGTAQARAALRSLLAKGKVGAAGIGNGVFTELYLGDKVKHTVEFAAFGAMTQGTDGEMSWTTDPAMGIYVASGEEQGAVQRLYALGRRAPWRTLYASAETVARTDLDGRPHYELRMTPAKGKPEKWFVDAASHMITRVDLALPDMMGGELPCQFRFADWKEIDGVLFPQKKTQKVGTYEIVFDYSTIQPNAKVTAEQVAPSDKVLAAAADRERQTPRAPSAGKMTLETLAVQHTATIRLQVDRADIGKTLAVVLPEVMAQLRKAGVSPAGPPFSRYHEDENGVVDLEAGMPVAKPITAEGRVAPSKLPAGKAATTWHIGPFEKLQESYGALQSWLTKEGLEPRGGPWEVYWTDPGIEPDPSKWRTQVFWPVK